MNALDPRSLIAIGAFMALVMGVVLGFMRRYYPRSILGLGHWAAAPVAWLGSAAFFWAANSSHVEVWRWLANGMGLLGFVLFHVGCRRFFDGPALWRRILVLYAVFMLLLAWFTWLNPSYQARVIIVSVATATVHVSTILFLWRNGNKNFPTLMLQATLTLHVCVLLMRLQTMLFAIEAGDLMEASAVQTFYLGAFVLSVLLLSIGAVLIATDRVRTELEEMATHDGLTGALNRRAVLSYGEEEHERSVRYGQPFSVMMIDLDHFKNVNDTHGHQHGDRVLTHFAESTLRALRRADRLGRYGGEEFLVLLPNTTADAAMPVAARIRAALAAGHLLDCQVSMGITDWQGPQDSLEAMLTRADAALYLAKAQGRDQARKG